MAASAGLYIVCQEHRCRLVLTCIKQQMLRVKRRTKNILHIFLDNAIYVAYNVSCSKEMQHSLNGEDNDG